MGKRIGLMALAMLVACALASLVGCDKYEPQSSENGALSYYQEKYGTTAKISESHALGNYQLFGYSYHGMEYVMSDGWSVIYDDGEGIYRDNRQDAEIQRDARAFASSKLEAIPGTLAAPRVESVGSAYYGETYVGEGVCWHARYDGDIEKFLEEEWPSLWMESYRVSLNYSEGARSYSAAYDEAYAAGLDEAYLDLGRYFDLGSITLVVADAQAFASRELTLFDEGLTYQVTFSGDSASTQAAKHFKPVFVPLVDGATISSGVPDVTLQEGDVRFEEQGEGFYTCHLSGAAATEDMSFFIRNDYGPEITKVNGIDSFTPVCEPGGITSTSNLVDGATYYLGYSGIIKPWIELTEVGPNRIVARYHTYFKDQIHTVDLRVIGMARKDSGGAFESTEFESRIVSETADGWICEVDIPKGAKVDNALHFQFSYNNDSDVSVQVEQPVTIPEA